MLHSQHLIGFESIDVLDFLIVLDSHAGSALSHIAAASALLDQVEENTIFLADLLNSSIELLDAVTV